MGLYTSAYSLGNKEELQLGMWSEKCNVVGITDMAGMTGVL